MPGKAWVKEVRGWFLESSSKAKSVMVMQWLAAALRVKFRCRPRFVRSMLASSPGAKTETTREREGDAAVRRGRSCVVKRMRE